MLAHLVGTRLWSSRPCRKQCSLRRKYFILFSFASIWQGYVNTMNQLLWSRSGAICFQFSPVCYFWNFIKVRLSTVTTEMVNMGDFLWRSQLECLKEVIFRTLKTETGLTVFTSFAVSCFYRFFRYLLCLWGWSRSIICAWSILEYLFTISEGHWQQCSMW